jgi:hypothetical protein
VGITGRIALASTASAGITATALFAAAAPAAQAGTGGSFIGGFKKLTTIGSTVPANGDVNPYGMARVTKSQGSLIKGNILISNFNNSKNLQGTGTTIVQVSPQGRLSVFAKINAAKLPGKCPGGVGLIVETTPSGNQVAKKVLDASGSPPGAGTLFGLVLAPHNAGVYYVDDAVNTMRLLH